MCLHVQILQRALEVFGAFFSSVGLSKSSDFLFFSSRRAVEVDQGFLFFQKDHPKFLGFSLLFVQKGRRNFYGPRPSLQQPWSQVFSVLIFENLSGTVIGNACADIFDEPQGKCQLVPRI
jgi:hypothetical protein